MPGTTNIPLEQAFGRFQSPAHGARVAADRQSVGDAVELILRARHKV
jgi:hypothetical protein